MRLSKQEKIDILLSRIENFKKSLQDKNTFDWAIYNSNSPKADRIRKWGEALEALHELGIYKEPITTISSYIKSELKEIGLFKAIPHARRALPFKYKDPSKVRDEQLITYDTTCDHHARKTKQQITKENQPLMNWVNSNITLFQSFNEQLETKECLIHIPPLEFNEMVTRSNGMDKLITQSWDGREKVLPEQTHLLLFAASQGTKSDMFAKYMKYSREILEMTPKQTVRFAQGRVTKVELLYEPIDLRDARRSGFYGVKCDECGSWRIDRKYNPEPPDSKEDEGGRNMLFCYACKSWQEIRTEPLMNKVI